MIESMATVHMTYSEVSNNFAAVLKNIRNGVEVIVDQDHRPVALIRSPKTIRAVHLGMHRLRQS